jgi:cytochrome c biogenesis protein CcmG, thiol:disulfide interchange protein DsbE
MWKFLIPAALFAVLLVFFARSLDRDPGLVPSPLIGKPAPSFSLPSLDGSGRRVSQDDLRGRYTLVNVWGTWCAGCREEHEVLLAIARESGIPIVGLNWKDETALARSWLARLGNPYVLVGEDADGRVAIDWGVYGAPETFLVDPQGIVRRKQIGPMTLEIWRRDFQPLIAAGSAG